MVKDLPKYKDGKQIEYVWTEEAIEGYKLTSSKTEGNVTTLTNTHIPENPDEPDTGDNSHLGAWMTVLTISLVSASLLAIYLYRRKRED